MNNWAYTFKLQAYTEEYISTFSNAYNGEKWLLIRSYRLQHNCFNSNAQTAGNPLCTQQLTVHSSCKEPFIKSTPVKTNHRLHGDHKSAHVETVGRERRGGRESSTLLPYSEMPEAGRGMNSWPGHRRRHRTAHHSRPPLVRRVLYVQRISQRLRNTLGYDSDNIRTRNNFSWIWMCTERRCFLSRHKTTVLENFLQSFK